MGLQGAMNSAVSGLSAQGNAMSVIGNNISNSNTTAYKANRALFSDVLAQEISSAGGNSQVGRGVNTATVDPDFSQGTFESSSSNTDLAVDGPGMFIMGEPQSGEVKYTRDGAFDLNEQGNLVNPTGQRVQGYELNEAGETVGDLTDVQVNTNDSIPAQQTTQIDLSTNLNANATEKPGGFVLSNPNNTSNFTTSATVYDSLGESHTLTTYFTKTSDANNEWSFNTTVSFSEVNGTSGNKADTDGDGNDDIASVLEGNVQFDQNGAMDVSTLNLSVGSSNDTNNSGNPNRIETADLQWKNGADDGQTVEFYSEVDGEETPFNISQFSGQSEVVRQEQNGYASGNLVDVNVDQEGRVIANYSNGETTEEYRLGLAQFPNTNGLRRAGDNLYEATSESGARAVGVPGSSVGTIRSNSLEQSNVDIAKQFTDMITTQRAYQANSRTISTTKDMLQEVINLTR